MRAPEGRTVELHVTAPDWDVIHSWWIPALGGKMDAIPGKLNKTWFEAKRVGVFQGQCAELCGIYHAKMLASVEVMPAAEFDAWLEERRAQQEAGTSPLGEELWEGSCAKCHGLDGEGGYGPRIAGTELIKNPQAVEALLRKGGSLMPPVGRDWTPTRADGDDRLPGAGPWRLESSSRRSPPGSAARSRAGSSPSTTSGSGSSTSRPRGSSSRSPGSSRS